MVTILLGNLERSTTNKTNIKNKTSGRIARTPVIISNMGVLSQTVGSALTAVFATDAASIIASGLIVNDKNIARISTARIGNSDAKVTTPKPDREDSPLPAAFAIPIPSDKTKGTVTGPVVTAPQSHARPKIDRKLGSSQA